MGYILSYFMLFRGWKRQQIPGAKDRGQFHGRDEFQFRTVADTELYGVHDRL